MPIIARVFPVKSKAAIAKLGKAIDEWDDDAKIEFARHFGVGGVERWFYQEIDGKPHVVSVADIDQPQDGFQFLATTDDPFTVWFREQVKDITGVDLTERPKGPPAELVYELRA